MMNDQYNDSASNNSRLEYDEFDNDNTITLEKEETEEYTSDSEQQEETEERIVESEEKFSYSSSDYEPELSADEVYPDILEEESYVVHITIAFMKRIRSFRSDPSFKFKLCEQYDVPPWDKLREKSIKPDSILCDVKLVKLVRKPSSGWMTYTASMIHPYDDVDVCSSSIVIPEIEHAISGYVENGKNLTTGDFPVVLVPPPEEIKQTFLSTIGEEWTIEQMKDDIYESTPIPTMERRVHMNKGNPIFLSYLMASKAHIMASGRRGSLTDWYESHGRNRVMIDKSDADCHCEMIIHDSKKNITADDFYRNFTIEFQPLHYTRPSESRWSVDFIIEATFFVGKREKFGYD